MLYYAGYKTHMSLLHRMKKEELELLQLVLLKERKNFKKCVCFPGSFPSDVVFYALDAWISESKLK